MHILWPGFNSMDYHHCIGTLGVHYQSWTYVQLDTGHLFQTDESSSIKASHHPFCRHIVEASHWTQWAYMTCWSSQTIDSVLPSLVCFGMSWLSRVWSGTLCAHLVDFTVWATTIESFQLRMVWFDMPRIAIQFYVVLCKVPAILLPMPLPFCLYDSLPAFWHHAKACFLVFFWHFQASEYWIKKD